MTLLTNRHRTELDALLLEQQAVIEELHRRVRDTSQSTSDLAPLVARSAELQRRVQRIVDAQRVQGLRGGLSSPASLKGLTSDPPIRDVVADTLRLAGVPLAARILAELAAVFFERQIPAARLASIRRDEERAYDRRPTARPEWIVPAINAVTLTAMPRLIALSSWESRRRLVGPRSVHVNHLRTIIAIVEHVGQRPSSVSPEQRVVSLVRRLAAPLVDPQRAGSITLDAMAQAAREELDVIEPDDRRDREQGERLLYALPLREQLWGRRDEELDAEYGAGIRKVR